MIALASSSCFESTYGNPHTVLFSKSEITSSRLSTYVENDGCGGLVKLATRSPVTGVSRAPSRARKNLTQLCYSMYHNCFLDADYYVLFLSVENFKFQILKLTID